MSKLTFVEVRDTFHDLFEHRTPFETTGFGPTILKKVVVGKPWKFSNIIVYADGIGLALNTVNAPPRWF